jgi:hypothetical protein
VALSGAFLLGGVLAMVWNYHKLQSWQPVTARVIATDITKFTRWGVDRYRGEVTIRYSVDDLLRRIPYSLPNSYTTNEAARAEVNHYPPGATMRVFYNPANGNDMVLDLSASPRFFLLPATLAALGLMLGLCSLRTLRRMGQCLCPGCAASVELWDKFCYACDHKLPRQKKLVRL